MVNVPFWQCPGSALPPQGRLTSLGGSAFQERVAGPLIAQPLPRVLEPAASNLPIPPRLNIQEDKRLKQEVQAAQRQEEARSRRQAARQEINAAYREVVIEQGAAEAEAEAEAEAVPPPAEPAETHSEAVARMMRERHEAREQTQREVAQLQGRAAARRAAAASSGGAAAAPRTANAMYNRSLFQRPLLPAEPIAPATAAAAAGATGAAAMGAGKSAPARDAWAWVQQREEAPAAHAAASGGEVVALDAVSE